MTRSLWGPCTFLRKKKQVPRFCSNIAKKTFNQVYMKEFVFHLGFVRVYLLGMFHGIRRGKVAVSLETFRLEFLH